MTYIVTAPLVLAKSQDGRIHHAYHGGVIEWLSDDQADHFLAHGMVEKVTPAEIVAITDAQERHQLRANEAEIERVRRCLQVIEELELPLHVGRPTMRAALEARGHKFANDTISGALKLRRELSRTPQLPAYPVVADEPVTADGQG